VFELVAKQAGQELKCPQCETSCPAPKLGSLRQLETIGGAEPSSQEAASGGARNGLFVAGLALAIFAGAAGVGLFQYGSSMIVKFDVVQEIDSFDEWMDDRPPAEVVAVYEAMDVERGLGDWVEQPHVGSTRQGRILQFASYGLMGLAGVGLSLVIGSFFFAGRNNATR
jgi:hypothetical protein